MCSHWSFLELTVARRNIKRQQLPHTPSPQQRLWVVYITPQKQQHHLKFRMHQQNAWKLESIEVLSFTSFRSHSYSNRTSTDLFQATHCNDLAPSFNALPHILPGLTTWNFPFQDRKISEDVPKNKSTLDPYTGWKIRKWSPPYTNTFCCFYICFDCFSCLIRDPCCMELGQSQCLTLGLSTMSYPGAEHAWVPHSKGLSSPVCHWIWPLNHLKHMHHKVKVSMCAHRNQQDEYEIPSYLYWKLNTNFQKVVQLEVDTTITNKKWPTRSVIPTPPRLLLRTPHCCKSHDLGGEGVTNEPMDIVVRRESVPASGIIVMIYDEILECKKNRESSAEMNLRLLLPVLGNSQR